MNNATERIVDRILACPATEEAWTTLDSTLKRDLAAAPVEELVHALQALDFARHTLGALHMLVAACASPPSNPIHMVGLIQRLLVEGDAPQLRVGVATLVRVCDVFEHVTQTLQQPIAAVHPLYTALRKLQRHELELTPLHARFLRMCQLAKTYTMAVPLIGEWCVQVPKSLKVDDVLLYAYYLGRVCCALKRWRDALRALSIAFVVPASALSAITLQAYKLYILASLLATGHARPLPSLTPASVTRTLKPLAQPYTEIATAFSTYSERDVRACVDKHAELVTRDGLDGMVQLVCGAVTPARIQRLTKTFLTLSLADIARRCELASPAEAERHLLALIAQERMHAHIDRENDGMVAFEEDNDAYDDRATLTRLHGEIARTHTMAQLVQTLDNAITADPAYQSTQMWAREKKKKKDGAVGAGARKGGDPTTGMDLGPLDAPDGV